MRIVHRSELSEPYFPTGEIYTPVGRMLLLNDPDPEEDGTFRYQRDLSARAYVKGKKSDVPKFATKTEEIVVLPFRIDCHPVIGQDQAAAAKFDVMSRLRVRAHDAMDRQEDVEIIKVINAAVPADHRISVAGTLQPENMNLAMSLLEEHNLSPTRFVMHPQRWKDCRMWGPDAGDVLEVYDKDDRSRTGAYGMFLGKCEIVVSTMVPKNALYCLPDPEYLGVFCIGEYRTQAETEEVVSVIDEPQDDHENGSLIMDMVFGMKQKSAARTDVSRVGVHVKESVGICVINDYACACIMV
jgi:hypothetical protein